jgi:hypothetical protein
MVLRTAHATVKIPLRDGSRENIFQVVLTRGRKPRSLPVAAKKISRRRSHRIDGGRYG